MSKCKAVVYRRINYNKHPRRGQCQRSATDSGYCWQHSQQDWRLAGAVVRIHGKEMGVWAPGKRGAVSGYDT